MHKPSAIQHVHLILDGVNTMNQCCILLPNERGKRPAFILKSEQETWRNKSTLDKSVHMFLS